MQYTRPDDSTINPPSERAGHACLTKPPDWQDGPVTVHLGDCLDVMRGMPEASVDALVTDPPAGIAFMGKDWDSGRGGRKLWEAWLTERMVEAYRVLRPGGLGAVWAIPRTAHWTANALEDAGFEIHPNGFVAHLFAQGFPKHPTHLKPAAEVWWLVRKPGPGGLNIDACRIACGDKAKFPTGYSKATGSTYAQDAYSKSWVAGGDRDPSGRWPANVALSHAEGCVPVGTRKVRGTNVPGGGVYHNQGFQKGWAGTTPNHYADADGTETVEAWECVEGCPAAELDRQSGVLTSGSRAAGVRPGLGFHGANGDGGPAIAGDTGGASRFFATFGGQACGSASAVESSSSQPSEPGGSAPSGAATPAGRLAPSSPAPSTSATASESSESAESDTPPTRSTEPRCSPESRRGSTPLIDPARSVASQPTATIPTTHSRSSCATSADSITFSSTPPNSAPGVPDSGARFIYTSKASARERSAGLPPGQRNTHPTVKPLDLMRWLCRLVTPAAGTVVDPFMGSGSTGCAAVLEGLRFVGIEQDPESVETAKARIRYWRVAGPEPRRPAKAATVAEGQLPLIEEVIAMPDPAQQLGLEGL